LSAGTFRFDATAPGGVALLLLLLLGCTADRALAQVSVAALEFGFHPAATIAGSLDDGPATRASVQVVRGSLVIPFVYRTPGTLVVSSLSGSRVGIAPRPLDPARDEPLEALWDLDFNIVAIRSLSEHWELTAVVSPGMASDLRTVGGNHVTLQGAVLANRTVRSTLSWGLGASATNAFGESSLIPLAALAWTGERARVDLLLPANAEFLWTPTSRVQAGFTAGVSGNAYALGRAGELRDAVVRYSVVEAGPAVRLLVTPSLRLSVAAGGSFGRRLEIESPDGRRIQDARLERGFTIRAGLSWLLPDEEGGG